MCLLFKPLHLDSFSLKRTFPFSVITVSICATITITNNINEYKSTPDEKYLVCVVFLSTVSAMGDTEAKEGAAGESSSLIDMAQPAVLEMSELQSRTNADSPDVSDIDAR